MNTSNITNYKPKDFAELLGVSVKTLQRWDRECRLCICNAVFVTHLEVWTLIEVSGDELHHFIFVIELIQFVTQRGYLQTDDVIMNVLGGVAGYTFWRLIFKWRK